MAAEKTHTKTCFFCSRPFNFGGGRYDGKWLSYYQISTCDSCYRSNWDGWNDSAEEKLVRHLESKGIALPARNEKGLLPQNPTQE